MSTSTVNIFDYSSYRDFLKDFYQERKKKGGYTYRDFSKSAGMNSSSWLLLLINGSKNLTPESILRVAAAVGLKKKETDYFELLVHYTQAKTTESKNHYYQKMLVLKRKLNLVNLTEDQFNYFANWYHPVIRSLITKVSQPHDYPQIAKLLIPAITPREVEKSLELLLRLGLIEKANEGAYRQTSVILSTGDEVSNMSMVHYHQEISKLASEAFERMPPEHMDISSLTLGISAEDFEKIKTKIREFRKEIMRIAQESTNEDRVCQLNFQLFHVSHILDPIKPLNPGEGHEPPETPTAP